MPDSSAYKRIQRITEFAWHCTSEDQLVAFLGNNICPFGELTAVGTAHLDDDGYIRVQTRFGFSESLQTPPPVHISADHPSVKALQEMKIQVIDMNRIHENHRDLPETVKPNSEYLVSIAMPVTMSKIYGFAFQRDIRKFDEYIPYLEFISSILSHWENMHSSKLISSLSKPIAMGQELTSRQEIIVALIKEGETNSSIAMNLGYSESLIRQETVSIYRKLGVNGRKELMDSNDVNNAT